MNKFKFSALGVLRHKEWLEKEAQRILGLELNKLNVYRETLEALQNERTRITDERRNLKDLSPESHLLYIQFDKKLSVDIQDQQQKVELQLLVIKEKTQILNDSVKERKKLEKLREREFTEYAKVTKRKETSKMDEVSANFFNRMPEPQ